MQKELAERKLHDKKTYEGVIWDLMEDALELDKETKKANITPWKKSSRIWDFEL